MYKDRALYLLVMMNMSFRAAAQLQPGGIRQRSASFSWYSSDLIVVRDRPLTRSHITVNSLDQASIPFAMLAYDCFLAHPTGPSPSTERVVFSTVARAGPGIAKHQC